MDMHHLAILTVITLLASGTIDCAAVYYGVVGPAQLAELSKYSIVVLSPLIDGNTVRELTRKGTVVLGYVSISTVGGWEPWAGNITESMVVERNQPWGELVVNVCDTRWGRVLLHAVNYTVSKGFSGVFLDNLDVVDKHPWMASCIERLVADIRSTYPHIKIMVNRGFKLLPRIAKYIDYVLFEDFISYYDFSAGRYRFYGPGDLEWIRAQVEMVHSLEKRYGIKLYLLAYAPPNDKAFLERLCKLWESIDPEDPLYVTTWRLDAIGACNPCIQPVSPREAMEYHRERVMLAVLLAITVISAALIAAKVRRRKH